MADLAYTRAQTAYMDLRQRALECSDTSMAEDLVTAARMLLDDSREEQNMPKMKQKRPICNLSESKKDLFPWEI